MAEYIVDTNVPLIAQDHAHMLPSCGEACSKFMQELFAGNYTLVLDEDDHILSEYKGRMAQSTQNTFGKQFLIWIYTNQWDVNKVKKVTISHTGAGNYNEVPQSLIDCEFDISDRKFVAVAVANNFSAPIVQSADSKWIGWLPTLVVERVIVHFLCKVELQAIHERKSGRKSKGKSKK